MYPYPDAASTPRVAEASPLGRVMIEVDLPFGSAAAAAEPVRQALQALAPFVVASTAARQDAVMRGVVEAIVAATPIRELDAQRAALEQKAVAALFAGTPWLTAEQIGRLRDPKARNPHSAANRWRSEGKIFSVTRSGVQYFPRYALDETLEPRPVVNQVLSELAALSPFRLASWFESTNSTLGGKRPREVLGEQPQQVLAAAQAHMLGALHG